MPSPERHLHRHEKVTALMECLCWSGSCPTPLGAAKGSVTRKVILSVAVTNGEQKEEELGPKYGASETEWKGTVVEIRASLRVGEGASSGPCLRPGTISGSPGGAWVAQVVFL